MGRLLETAQDIKTYTRVNKDIEIIIALPIFFLGSTISSPLFVIVVKPLKLSKLNATDARKAIGATSLVSLICIKFKPSGENCEACNAAKEKTIIPIILIKDMVEVKVCIKLLPDLLT